MKKNCCKTTIAVAAGLGLVAGAAIAHKWFLCPETTYPACYHQMFEKGFTPFNGVTYDVSHSWQKDTLTLNMTSDILCPYEADVELLKLVKDKNGARNEVVASGVATFDAGKAQTLELDRSKVANGENVTLVVRGKAPAEDAAGFHIEKPVGQLAYLRNHVFRLTAE